MFNLTQKVLFNLTLISQIEQIFLIFFRIPCYRHSGADAALPRPLKKCPIFRGCTNFAYNLLLFKPIFSLTGQKNAKISQNSLIFTLLLNLKLSN